MMSDKLRRSLDSQLAFSIREGKREVTMDDATDDGRIAADRSGAPNARQNSLGSYLPTLARRGLLEATDRHAKGRSPRRRGGTHSVWLVTDEGVAWAEEMDDG